ncbi:hypothetical protein CsSME_00013321 [Camellia sinensis var. sinensis]
MHLSISSLVAIPFSSTFATTPTPQTCSRKCALVVWSRNCGIATTGTPKLTASTVEFHPQCVMKHPTYLPPAERKQNQCVHICEKQVWY